MKETEPEQGSTVELIDDEEPPSAQPSGDAPSTEQNVVASSLKCNEFVYFYMFYSIHGKENEKKLFGNSYSCNKLLANMDAAMLHAERTGHQNFGESTEAIKPLTDEERQKQFQM